MMIRSLCSLVALLTLVLLTACGSGGLPASLGDCPDDSTVTWAQAGTIFSSNCVSCHSIENTGAERVGAKENVDYDNADVAFNSSGATPQDTWASIYADEMPPGDATLSDADALVIHEWLSCGGPE